KVKNVYLETPVLELLNGTLADELKSLGVKNLGRFKSLTGMPALSSFTFQRGDPNLTGAVTPLRLGATLTSESDNPLVLSLDASSGCKQVLLLQTMNPEIHLL